MNLVKEVLKVISIACALVFLVILSLVLIGVFIALVSYVPPTITLIVLCSFVAYGCYLLFKRNTFDRDILKHKLSLKERFK